MKYIRKIDERLLYNDGIGKAELWDFSRANENEESRIEAVSAVASICYGKPPKDAKKLVERLWTESGGLPSSAFEFVRTGVEPSIIHSLRNLPTLPFDEEERIRVSLAQIQARHREEIATFRIKAPIFIARQVMRHRSFSYQELSRRYTTDKRVPLEFWGFGDKTGDGADFLDGYAGVIDQAILVYWQALDVGVRAEVARAVLPLGLYTQFWMMGDVPAWRNYFKLRLDSHTQKEHRELAQAMLELLKEHQPRLYEKVEP